MAEEGQPNKARVDIEAKPKLVGKAAFKNSVNDLAGDLAEPGIVLAAGGSASQAAWAGLRGILISRVLGPLGLISGSVLAIGAAMKMVVGQTRLMAEGLRQAEGMERLVTMFRPLLGGTQAAKARLSELFQFAATTPFQINGIAEASRLLEILTQGALSSTQGLRMIGDAAAIAGRPLKEVSFWTGRLYDAMKSGAPTGESLMRLQEMGVVTGATRRQIEQLSEAGASFAGRWAIVEKALKRNKGGMELLAQSSLGLKTTLADVRAAMARQFGQNFLEHEKNQIKNAITVTEAFTPVLEQLGSHLAAISAPGRTMKDTLLQNEGAMRALASGVKVAMDAFIAFGMAVVGAQVLVTAKGILDLKKAAGSLGAAMKLAAANGLNMAKAKAQAARISQLNATANKLEAAAINATTAAEKRRLTVMAGSVRSKAKAASQTAATGGAITATTKRGKIMAGVLKLLTGAWRLFTGAVKAAFGALMSGVGLAGAALGGIAAAVYFGTKAWNKHRKAIEAVRDALKENREEYEKQAEAIRTVTDQLELEKTLVDQLADAEERLQKAKKKDRENVLGNEKEVEAALQNRNEIREWLWAVRTGLETGKSPEGENLERTDRLKRMKEDVELERRLAEITFRANLERATGQEKLIMLAQKRNELEQRITKAQDRRKVQNNQEFEGKRQSTRLTELENRRKLLEQTIEDLEPKSGLGANLIGYKPEKTEEEKKQEIELKLAEITLAVTNAEIAQIEAAQKKRRDNEAERAKDPEALKVDQDVNNISELEERKAELIQRLKTLREERERTIRLAKEEKRIDELASKAAIAAANGNLTKAAALREQARDQEAYVQQLKRLLNLIKNDVPKTEAEAIAKGEQANRDREREARERKFRNNRARRIPIARADAEGDEEGARALKDNAKLRKLIRENMMKGGMDPGQARKAAMVQMRAEIGAAERSAGSQIQADRFRRIGRGGVATGSDPAQRARERMVEMQRVTNQTLREILMEGGPL